MTLWASPSNSWINCQHLPCSTSSPPCTPSFSQYKGPDPAILTPVCKPGALLGSHMQMTLQKGQHCRMRCPIQIQPIIFKQHKDFVPRHAHLSYLAFLGNKGIFSLFLLLLKHFVDSCQSEGLAFHTENFLSRSSPQSYFHLGLTLHFSLLHYLPDFNCELFRRGCLSSCIAQVHGYLHSCPINNSLPVTVSLGM